MKPHRTTLHKLLFTHKKAVLFLIVVIVLLGSATILKQNTPSTPALSSEPWNDVSPGQTIDDQSELAKNALRVVDDEKSTTIEYESPYPSFPNQVVIDNRINKVVYTVRQLPLDSADSLSDYVKKYGQVDIVAGYPALGRTVRANVFLEKGVVVAARVQDGGVEEVWNFIPTTEETFWARFGNFFTKGTRFGDAFPYAEEELQ